jgi:hypothetical protein
MIRSKDASFVEGGVGFHKSIQLSRMIGGWLLLFGDDVKELFGLFTIISVFIVCD